MDSEDRSYPFSLINETEAHLFFSFQKGVSVCNGPVPHVFPLKAHLKVPDTDKSSTAEVLYPCILKSYLLPQKEPEQPYRFCHFSKAGLHATDAHLHLPEIWHEDFLSFSSKYCLMPDLLLGQIPGVKANFCIRTQMLYLHSSFLFHPFPGILFSLPRWEG